MKHNGHKAPATRVYYKKGDWVVTDNVWDATVDGPHQMTKDGYRMQREGRRHIKVFTTEADAMRWAEAKVAEYVESDESE